MGKSQVPIFVFKTNRGTHEAWFFVTEMEQKSEPAQTTHRLLTNISTYFDLVLASTVRELSLLDFKLIFTSNLTVRKITDDGRLAPVETRLPIDTADRLWMLDRFDDRMHPTNCVWFAPYPMHSTSLTSLVQLPAQHQLA